MEKADLCLQLMPLLRQRLAETHQEKVFYEIETPLLPVLAEMERNGVKIDVAVLRELGARLDSQMQSLEASIYQRAGARFNLNSPKQMGQVLFDQLKLAEKPRKTKTGQYVTNEEVLEELAANHTIAAEILAYREASKLKSTYVDALPQCVSPRSGRVHTTYLQMLTATGRLASNSPNLQNIPIRSEQGREIRRAFVPGHAGWLLLSADYNQIELRIMAELSGDDFMIGAFQDGKDIHSATAAKVYGIPEADVTPEMRRTAKMVNFGIIYGISAFGLAQRLAIPRSDAARLIDEYFVQYPHIKAFMDRTIESAKARGFVETITGRRRHLRDINSANATIRKAAERTAINTPIQGSAADMIKLAMVRVSRRLKAENFAAKMLLQVHDELVLEAPEQEVSSLKTLLAEEMRQALPMRVPVRVDFGSGKNWSEAHA
jgi:DNA polymerase-1